MINEEQINQAVELISEDQDQILIDFGMGYPALSNYLLSDQFLALSQEEKNILLFTFLVIYKSIPEEDIKLFDFDVFSQKEDSNWEVFEAIQKLSWEEKMDKAFENYPQEDLLAFVEDLLIDDEDSEPLTLIGKEFIFITAKSFIDCL